MTLTMTNVTPYTNERKEAKFSRRARAVLFGSYNDSFLLQRRHDFPTGSDLV